MTDGSAFSKRDAGDAGSVEPVTWTVAISDGQSAGLLIHSVPVGVMTNGKIDLLCLCRRFIPRKWSTVEDVKKNEWSNPRKTVEYDKFSPVTQACVHAVAYGWGMTALDYADKGIVTIAADMDAAGFDAQSRVLRTMLHDAAGMEGVRVVEWADCVDGLRLRPEVILPPAPRSFDCK